MEKVLIIINGKTALVDADQVKLHLLKSELVEQAMQAKKDGLPSVEYANKIIKLNKKIRKNVIFVQ